MYNSRQFPWSAEEEWKGEARLREGMEGMIMEGEDKGW